MDEVIGGVERDRVERAAVNAASIHGPTTRFWPDQSLNRRHETLEKERKRKRGISLWFLGFIFRLTLYASDTLFTASYLQIIFHFCSITMRPKYTQQKFPKTTFQWKFLVFFLPTEQSLNFKLHCLVSKGCSLHCLLGVWVAQMLPICKCRLNFFLLLCAGL